jgi:hypothetical protein
MHDDFSHFRMIATNLLDEVLAEAETCSPEHEAAQAAALKACGKRGESRDPKLVARALLIAIADAQAVE